MGDPSCRAYSVGGQALEKCPDRGPIPVTVCLLSRALRIGELHRDRGPGAGRRESDSDAPYLPFLAGSPRRPGEEQLRATFGSAGEAETHNASCGVVVRQSGQVSSGRVVGKEYVRAMVAFLANDFAAVEPVTGANRP